MRTHLLIDVDTSAGDPPTIVCSFLVTSALSFYRFEIVTRAHA